ncbi:hypothetical protein AGABI2DRAFT_134926, partial [Agaricus bisporus var. bisporus H97]|uniref:hypothetical protein n=1 Tax=Agaricus bisporus var. bisporus (strain H97 / ATCC MYA-4626 / FGSC 10389) TaxID=936046 RepID=UPI00029F7B54
SIPLNFPSGSFENLLSTARRLAMINANASKAEPREDRAVIVNICVSVYSWYPI